MRRWLATAATTALLIGSALTVPGVALATSPANDDFASATLISATPFSDVIDNTTASLELGEPQTCGTSTRTVWYEITPGSAETLRADMSGSSFYDTNMVVWEQTGSGFGGLAYVACATYGTTITFSAQAGTTYYLQASDMWSGGGSLHLNVQQLLPPPNDDYADATVISALPFDESVDAVAATTEPGEPSPTCLSIPTPSIWYTFTAESAATMLASAQYQGYQFILAVYTGDSLASLQEAGCGVGTVAFQAQHGVTYHLQVMATTMIEVGLKVAPPPNAAFYFYPNDPSTFDTLQFYDSSYDPAGIGIDAWSWDFGDGTTATSSNPQHRYVADGDYTVSHGVTTVDGRAATISQVVHVATHDVAITKLSAPSAASVGQTRQISVGVSDTRYPESVQVQLLKSSPAGWETVGTLVQSVPVRPLNRTTTFTFSYTFTSGDAAVGKVTFRAEAMILGSRDALPADNVAIAPPTKLNK